MSDKEKLPDNFGRRVAYHRMQRDMTEGQVADAMNELIEKGAYDASEVQKWERQDDLPDVHAYRLLQTILIRDNKAIPDDDKEAALDDFAFLFSKAHEDLDQGKDVRKWQYNFGRMLGELRVMAEMNESELADALNEQISKEQYSGHSIHRIEHNEEEFPVRHVFPLGRALELEPQQAHDLFYQHVKTRDMYVGVILERNLEFLRREVKSFFDKFEPWMNELGAASESDTSKPSAEDFWFTVNDDFTREGMEGLYLQDADKFVKFGDKLGIYIKNIKDDATRQKARDEWIVAKKVRPAEAKASLLLAVAVGGRAFIGI